MTPKKILIIKLRAIGDVVLSTIVIPNLRAAFPTAGIDFLTEPPATEVVIGNPALNQVISLDRRAWQTLPWPRRFAENYRLIRKLKGARYDLVFDFFGNPRSALLTWFTRAPWRVGYNWRGRQWAYNVVVPSRAAWVHEAEFHLDALSALGIPIVSRELYFPIASANEPWVQAFLEQHRLASTFLVGINISGGWAAKKWPLEKFAALGDQLVQDYQAKILIFWGPGEREDALKLTRLMQFPAVLIPPTSLNQAAALIRQCRLLISNDSGPMHIAAALKIPTVGIFGPTNAQLQGPYGDIHEIAQKTDLNCLGCNQTACEHNACMQKLAVTEVLQAIQRCMMKNNLVSQIQ
ncbi:glycosyltransferase family 9 protein [candidate division KSB1 bacterium]|nr:glycosyltransferase family 9 protein [candidate division KSB1 bacterium]